MALPAATWRRSRLPSGGQVLLVTTALTLALLWSALASVWLAAPSLEPVERSGRAEAADPAQTIAFTGSGVMIFSPSQSGGAFQMCSEELGYGGIDSCRGGRSRTSRGR